jgi:hypothetical protein
MVLSGTEIAATTSVSQIEARASRSVTAAHHGPGALAQRFEQGCAQRQQKDYRDIGQRSKDQQALDGDRLAKPGGAHAILRCRQC